MNNLSPTKKLRFLIAEDDIIARTLLQEFLSKFGECETTKDGLEAILAFAESYNEDAPFRYDLICLDLIMPRMGGVVCAKAIRGIEQEQAAGRPVLKTPIIFTSAVNDPTHILTACAECEAEHYYIKPLNFKNIASKLVKFGLLRHGKK